MDLSAHQPAIAKALTTLESRLERLVEALAHEPIRIRIEGAARDAAAVRQACEAYQAINYGMEDEVSTSVVCLGVLGVPADILRRAEAVNAAKAEFKALCVPLQRVRMRVPVKGTSGATKAIPVIRVILRSLQRSDLNLLAAYRKIPLLKAPPASVTYSRASTRAVYRKTVEEIQQLLAPMDGPDAASDRSKLSALDRNEKYLALTREPYDNIRANIVYARLDARGRGRVQVFAELPLMYARGRSTAAPEVNFPAPGDGGEPAPRRPRESKLLPDPYIRSLPVYRYRPEHR
jgi:hypothetical protein